MGRPKEIKDGMRLSVVLPNKQVEQVKRRATQMSAQENRLIGVFELIKMTVEVACPIPK